jgi:ATP-dependent helicase/nuclease subunit B
MRHLTHQTDVRYRSRDSTPVRDGQLRAPRRWERLLVEAAVIEGLDRWRRRIDGLANDLRLRLSELGAEDDTQATALSRTIEDLACLRFATRSLAGC